MDGDGYGDLAVGARFYDDGEADEGRVYLFSGSASGLASSASWTAEGNQLNASLGSSVSSAGDVNGDGFSDIVVGASSFDDGESDEGQAFLYLDDLGGSSAQVLFC